MIDRSLMKALCVGGVLLFAACGSENMAKDKSELLRGAGEVFGKYYVALKALQDGPTRDAVIRGDELRPADDCDSELEFWRKEGVGEGDAIFSYDFNAHPKAKQNTVPFSEARAICKEYRPLYARYRAAYDLYRAEGTLARMREYLKPDDPVVTPGMIAEYERTSNPKVVANALKEARKLDPDLKVGMRKLSLDSFESEVAAPLKDFAPKWIADARAAFRTRNEKLAAPYVAAGRRSEEDRARRGAVPMVGDEGSGGSALRPPHHPAV
jgi:hypothetical protein